MKILKLLLVMLVLPACGRDVVHTEIKEVCSSDSPAITLPNEVVCNHSPANNIEVEGKEVVYICTKIKGGNHEK